MNDQLKKIYEDPSDPGSLGGVSRLVQTAKDKGLKVNRQKVTSVS